MNLFYSATFRTMEARMPFFGGRFELIRPLAFAVASGYPLEGDLCPEGATSRRVTVRGILQQLETDSHGVRRRVCAAGEHAQEDLLRAVRKHLPDDLAS